MKKFVSFIIPLLMVMGIVACEPPQTTELPTGGDEELFEENATEIKMWMMDFEEWENQINISQRKKFNSNLEDGIQVKQTYIDTNAFDDLIRSAYESKNVPDIYVVSYGNVYKEIQTGRAIDITQYFDQSVWNDLTPNAKEGVCYNDKYYAFPINFEPSTIVGYRKDLLQQYAPGTTQIPNKWSDMIDLCKTVKKNIKASGTKGLYSFGFPTGVALAWGSWGMQYAATGGLAVTDDWSQSRISNQGYTELCNVFAEFYNNGLVPLAAGNYTEASFDLADGKAVMTCCGSWSLASILNTHPELRDQIGFAIMPTLTGNQDTVTATNGGWTYVISSECKNPEKAAEVIKFLTAEQTEQTVDYFQRAHYAKASPRKSVQAILSESYKNQTEVPTEWVEVVDYVASRAILEPIYDWDISVAVEGMLEEAAMGEDISAAVKKADQTIKDLITSRNLANTNPRHK